MSDELSYGLRAMQQGAEDYAKAQKEAQKAQAEAIGNRGLYDIAVKSGVLNLDQQIEFNKGNATKKNEILAGAMRTWNAQREMEQDQMRKQAFQLQQNQDRREQARFDWQPPPSAAAAAEAAGYVNVPTGPGQGQLVKKAPAPPTADQLNAIQANAAKAGGSVFQMPDGSYRFEKNPAPQTPPMPTIPVPVPGGTPIPVPITNPAAQDELKRMNPAGQAFAKYGARPEDFLPQNIVQGEIPFNDPKKYQFDPESKTKSHVMLKNLGVAIPNGEYSAWLRKFADAGQIDATKNPVTGEMISPPQKAAVANANPRVLDLTNPASIAIMQGFIKQYGDIDTARQAAQAQGYTW
jgi:hypothetical protein